MVILTVLQYLVYGYFLWVALYLLVFSLAGKWPLRRSGIKQSRLKKWLVLMPAYKEDAVVAHSALQATQQDYPLDLYDVAVVADSLRPKTIARLRKLPVHLVEVSFESSTKARALNAALERLPDIYEAVVVLDADNTMAPDFLHRMNQVLQNGHLVAQGHRLAANQDTPMALLDGISEEINNHIFRQGHRRLGLSAALIGSGMAFDYGYFKKVMAGIDAVGGFDKELELKLLKNRIRIEYEQGALVYDEKVRQVDVFETQRRRWLAAQVHYLKCHFPSGLREFFFAGNLDYFDKVLQMLLPPRLLLLGMLVVACAVSYCFPTMPSFGAWLALLGTVTLAILSALPSRFYNRKTIRALMLLPRVFVAMTRSLFRLKGANRKFLHTPHGKPPPAQR